MFVDRDGQAALPSLPPLTHLDRLTDDTGMYQFAIHSVPDPHSGYTLDDNVRGLLVALGYHAQGCEPDVAARLVYRYLAFMRWAQREDGQFHNELSYDRRWLDDVGSPDSQGRAIWALGYAAAYPLDSGSGGAATEMLRRALPHVAQLRSPRTRSYALLGVAFLVRAGHPLGTPRLLRSLADGVVDDFKRNALPDWRWFERVLAYDNGRIPQALLVAGQLLEEERYAHVAKEALDFYLPQVVKDDCVQLIGHDGWYCYGEQRAAYDQQPVDAASLVEVCSAAYAVLGDSRYRNTAELAWEWFHGRNSEGLVLYDPLTGGCHDGLGRGSVNDNQGAESTLSVLQAALALQNPEWLGVRERFVVRG